MYSVEIVVVFVVLLSWQNRSIRALGCQEFEVYRRQPDQTVVVKRVTYKPF